MNILLTNVSCVAINGRAVIISGAPGSGKSSLALGLIDRGAILIGDDGVSLQQQADLVIAAPPPNIAGLLEVRNIGLISLPTTSARVALYLDLTAQACRLPERIETIALCSIHVPRIALYPDAQVLPLRAEWALRQHGAG